MSSVSEIGRRFTVAQVGARMHYGIPRILAASGMLERLYTDLYAGPVLRQALKVLPASGPFSRLTGRHALGVPDGSVISFPGFGLEYAARLRRASSEAERWAIFL